MLLSVTVVPAATVTTLPFRTNPPLRDGRNDKLKC